jgi:hypothetical protein
MGTIATLSAVFSPGISYCFHYCTFSSHSLLIDTYFSNTALSYRGAFSVKLKIVILDVTSINLHSSVGFQGFLFLQDQLLCIFLSIVRSRHLHQNFYDLLVLHHCF